MAFLPACNFGKHRKALRWQTLFPAVCDPWKADASIFKIDPHHLIPAANNYMSLETMGLLGNTATASLPILVA